MADTETKTNKLAACPPLTDKLAAEARKAFVAMVKDENFFGPQYARQSLKAHWTGAEGGFADHMLQKRWHDFLAGFKAANAIGQRGGRSFIADAPSRLTG